MAQINFSDFGYTVDSCPGSKTEYISSATRLGCGVDENGRSQYVCVPNHQRSSLVEFCYKSTVPFYEKGNCIEVYKSGNLDQTSCLNFTDGCPDNHFFLSDLYKFPACQGISLRERCFFADPECPNITTLEGHLPPDNSTPTGAIVGSVVAVVVLIVLLVLITVVVLRRKHEYKRSGKCAIDTQELEDIVDRSEDVDHDSASVPDCKRPLLSTDDGGLVNQQEQEMDVTKVFKIPDKETDDNDQKQDIELNAYPKANILKCSLCADNGEDNAASCFCTSCEVPEPLCDICGRHHNRQRNMRDHLLSTDMDAYRSYVESNTVNCELCLLDGESNFATSFCLPCKQPLCNNCADHHVKQKQFRKHRINRGISFISELNESDDEACDICEIDGKRTKATKYCIDCDEHLCSECVKTHLKFRSEHVLTEKLSSSLHCEPCKRGNKSVSAKCFCENCDEPMCKACSEQHLKQKPSRNHVITSNFLKLSKPKSEKEKIHDNLSERLQTEDIQFKSKEEDIAETKKKIRTKPIALNTKSDSVELYWETLEENVDYYQIRYKSLKENDKWKFCNTNDTINKFIVTGLMADTPHIFQVRSVANDMEGDYSEQSDPINTTKSLATTMLNFSIKITNTDPVKYQLAAEENKEARNSHTKTRQLTLGNPSIGNGCEKTMMLVGASGSGKSTLVDGIINYILGVSFEDPFRFTLVNLEQDEKKTENKAESQTEWITVYKIAPQEGSRLDYTLNVIDTPGFGDTRGIQRDKAIVDQIRHLFSAEGKQGVAFIDAVCFIVKAPDARLTATQTYIFHSIMSIFGKDIETNICTLMSFADGAEPPVLSCLKAANKDA